MKNLFPPGYTVKLKDGSVYVKNADGSYTRVGTYSGQDGFTPAKNATPKSMGFTLAAQFIKDQFPWAGGNIYLGENNAIWLQKEDGSWVFLGSYDPETQTVTRSKAPEAHAE